MKIKQLTDVPFTNENININGSEANIINNKIRLSKGKYTLFTEFVVEKENRGDILALYLNNEVINNIELPIDEESVMKMKFSLDVNEDNSDLFLLNESDDTIRIKKIKGGIFMAVNLQIVNVLNFNPYSFDLELNVPFESDMDITVTKIATDGTETPVIISILDKLDITSPVDLEKVRTIKQPAAGTPLAPVLFAKDTDYRVDVLHNGESDSKIIKFASSTFQMMNNDSCKVNTIGTRLLVLEFDSAIQNLDALTNPYESGIYTKTSLNNFYISYFSSDPNMGQKDNEWIGGIDEVKAPTAGGTTIHPFSFKVSDDSRRIEIQNNLGEFNTGSSDIHKNHITINGTKSQNPSKMLMDYLDRGIAPFEGEFLSTRNSIPAKIVKIEVLTNVKVEVTFDAPVCSLIDYIKGTSLFTMSRVLAPALAVSAVTRVGNSFNKLLFTLDGTAPLTGSSVNLTVGSVLDASGLRTDEVTELVDIPLVDPTVTFDEVVSDVNAIPPTTTIILDYSEIMVTGVGANSCTNVANYKLLNITTGQEVPLMVGNVASVITTAQHTLGSLDVMIPVDLLGRGSYTLTVYDRVMSVAGNYINTTEINFSVSNSIIPTIEKVIAIDPVSVGSMSDNDNVFIIMFNQPMNVLALSEHSALVQGNYKLKVSATKSIVLNGNTKIENIYMDKWIRYTLPVDAAKPIPDFVANSADWVIHAGYSTADNVKWITTPDGTIYPLCDTKQINSLLPKLDIHVGSAEAVAENQIIFQTATGASANFFSSVNPLDFLVDVERDGNTTSVRPTTAVLETGSFTKVILTFQEGSFKIGDDIALKVSSSDGTVLSLDIFGKKIVEWPGAPSTAGTVDVTNKVPTTIEGLSLLSVAPMGVTAPNYSEALVELIFGMDIQYTEANDFDVYYKDALGAKHYCIVGSADVVPSIGTGRVNTIQLTALIPTAAEEEALFVSTVPGSSLHPFRTYDVASNKVSQFADMKVDILAVNNFAWTYNPVVAIGNDSYTFELGFSDDILTKYAIPAASLGLPINITTTLDATKKILTLDLTNGTLKLGTIDLYYNTALIAAPDTWRAAGALSAADSSKLLITIDAYDLVAENLFGALPAPSRGRGVYIPYDGTNNALIVNSTDTVQLYRLNRDTDLIN